jgi:hypothetical protein
VGRLTFDFRVFKDMSPGLWETPFSMNDADESRNAMKSAKSTVL